MPPDHVHTRDLHEAIETVWQVYCEHQLALDRRATGIDTTLHVGGSLRQPVIRLRYGAPVTVDAGHFPDLYLVMRCTRGSGSVRQGGRETQWAAGATVPVSANLGTAFQFGADFSQASIKPDSHKLETLCASWLGHPLDQRLRFDLRPFSRSLEAAWCSSLAMLDTANALPAAAEAALQEFMLTLLLQCHPHNFSAELSIQAPPLPSRLVQRAERFIREHSHEALTVACVARAMGVSVRALQAGFQEHFHITPMALLRQIRMDRVRQRLMDPHDLSTVTDAALESGFFHLGRFSTQYRAAFGESPHVTLMRNRGRLPAH